MDAVQNAELLNMIRTELAEVNTSMPAKIVAYDADSRMADVRPAIDKLTADGRVIEAPVIHGVQVRFLSAPSVQAIVSLPLNPGDGGILHFSQRSLDEWLNGTRAPKESRLFDLNDAFFVPGVDSLAELVPAEPDCLLIKIGAAVIRMYENGSAVVTLPAGLRFETPLATFTENVQVDDTLTATTDVMSGGISGVGHTHTEQGDGNDVSAPK